MTYAGSVKRAKSHFENCNNGPEETPVQGDCSYILTPRATGAFILEIEPKIIVCKYPDSLATENDWSEHKHKLSSIRQQSPSQANNNQSA